MSWKHERKLADLADGRRFEVVCRACGHARIETAGSLRTYLDAGVEALFMDEVEKKLRCGCKPCNGVVRVFMTFDHLIEPFFGGLP